MKFSRDSLVWNLGIAAALLAYLIADQRNPLTWDYQSWLKFIAAAISTVLAKLGTSPLKSRTAIKTKHPRATVI